MWVSWVPSTVSNDSVSFCRAILRIDQPRFVKLAIACCSYTLSLFAIKAAYPPGSRRNCSPVLRRGTQHEPARVEALGPKDRVSRFPPIGPRGKRKRERLAFAGWRTDERPRKPLRHTESQLWILAKRAGFIEKELFEGDDSGTLCGTGSAASKVNGRDKTCERNTATPSNYLKECHQ